MKKKSISGSESDELSLILDGRKVTADRFVKAVNAFFGLIANVASEMEGQAESIEWVAAVKEGSNVVRAIPHNANGNMPVALELMDAVIVGFNVLEKADYSRPRYFNRKAIQNAKELSSILDSDGDTVSVVKLKSRTSDVSLTPRTLAGAELLLGSNHGAIGSVEGRLHTVSDKSGFRFVIDDFLYNDQVTCYIEDEELVKNALSFFGQRVAAYGKVKYRKNGTPVSVEVNQIRVFKPKTSLPTVDDVTGIYNR
jgi:hypothetical protein